MSDTKISALTVAADLSNMVLAGEALGVNKAYTVALFDTRYQASSANLTSWAAIIRASGFDTFVATPSSANFASLITDETGTGKIVLATGPTISAPLFSGSTSGTTTLQATAVASGTLTLPAATDTLIGKATTDTLTNKTYDTAGTGNSFLINGLAATANTGTGSVVRAAAPTISGVAVFSGIPSLTGGALTFPASQVASSGANDLDDYVEGTFTPALSASGSTFSYSLQTGKYTKIGRLVQIDVTIVLNTSGNTLTGNTITITGLPVTFASGAGVFPVRWTGSTTSFIGVWGWLGSTSINLEGLTAAATSSATALLANGLCHATNGTTIRIICVGQV